MNNGSGDLHDRVSVLAERCAQTESGSRMRVFAWVEQDSIEVR
jgi:hypothetical protein